MKRSSTMIQCIIFDLSEVLIAGLVGIEKELSQELPIPEHEILPRFGGDMFHEIPFRFYRSPAASQASGGSAA